MESSSSVMVWMLNPSTMGPAYSSSVVVVVMLLGGGVLRFFGDGGLTCFSSSLAMVVLSGSLANGGLTFSSSSPSVSAGRNDMPDSSLISMITSFAPGSGMMYGSSSSFKPKYSRIEWGLKRYRSKKALAKSS